MFIIEQYDVASKELNYEFFLAMIEEIKKNKKKRAFGFNMLRKAYMMY